MWIRLNDAFFSIVRLLRLKSGMLGVRSRRADDIKRVWPEAVTARRMTVLLVLALIVTTSGCTTIAGAVAGVFGLREEEPERREVEYTRTPITIGEAEPERPSPLVEEEPVAEFAAAEQEILVLVNHHRGRQGLQPLLDHAELGDVARRHSEDMGSRGYYSHVDPDGVTPNERITDALSDRYYLLGTSENIAYRESSGGSAGPSGADLGRRFMDGWMNSPGHRANILRPESTHIGIGLSRAGNRVYATQKFMRYFARLEEVSNGASLDPDDPVVRFVMNPAAHNRDSLVVRIDLPDPNARRPLSSNHFHVGHGFVEPEWLDDNRFLVRLPVDAYGSGTYGIRLGEDGGNRTYTQTFRFHVP